METSPRAPISQRSREQVMKRREERAARGSTPPRARSLGSGETTNAATAERAGKLQAGLERAESMPAMAPKAAAAELQAPPALPPPKRAARSATPMAPLPPSVASPAVGFDAPATPAPSNGNGNGGTGDDQRERRSSRVRTPTMYQDVVPSPGSDDGDDQYADENTSLLSSKHISDMEHNAKIMSHLIEDVKTLKKKDAEIEQKQEELAQIDDEVDDACETLATFISLTFLAPTFSWTHTIVSLLLTAIVWGLQAFLTFKLYGNAKINDGGQAMLDLGSGYLELNHTMASAECDGCCDISVHSTECRLGMMDAFENAIFERKAGQCDGCEFSGGETDAATVGNRRTGGGRWSSEIYDMHEDWSPEPTAEEYAAGVEWDSGISLCLTERGLANGWLNLFLGMMIIIITLIREIQEALGGIYVVKKLKYEHTNANTGEVEMRTSVAAILSYLWVCFIVLFHCVIGVYLLYASFRRMINVPNDIWGVVESSISAFLVVSIDDGVLYVVLLHPMSKKAMEPLGQKSADLSKDEALKERQEKRDAQGREYPPYPNNPGPPRMLMHNQAKEGEDPLWRETECIMWHPTEHIMTAGGYLILYNYMIEWLYMHFFFWFVGGRLSKFVLLACEDAKLKNDTFRAVSLIIGKVGPFAIVTIGLLLDLKSIAGHAADRSRRLTRCFIFYVAAFLMAEMFSDPAWLLTDGENGKKRRFWELNYMIWCYRFLCFISLAVAIPMLSRKRWNNWFNKNHKSVQCSIHVGGLDGYLDETKRVEYEAELRELFGKFGSVLTTELRIRDVMEDGERKVSWALVSFDGESAAKKAVAQSIDLGKRGWVVKEVDHEQMENSDGAMMAIKADNHDKFHAAGGGEDSEFLDDDEEGGWQDENQGQGDPYGEDDEETALAGPKKVLAM